MKGKCSKCGGYTHYGVCELSKIGVSIKDEALCKCEANTSSHLQGVRMKCDECGIEHSEDNEAMSIKEEVVEDE
jgi:hypothetical protein|tara:strand:+ start:7160 stop:7381 length:222 start_codon:yes stop_codon:yes gene_type:complete